MPKKLTTLDPDLLQKKFLKKKTQFEDAYSGGQPYEVVNAIYFELKALQNEINRRLTEDNNNGTEK